MDVCGIDTSAIPKSARGAYNRAVAELRGVRATPHQIRERAGAYQHRFDHAAMTPTALVKHWASLGADTPRAPKPKTTNTPAGVSAWLETRGAPT